MNVPKAFYSLKSTENKTDDSSVLCLLEEIGDFGQVAFTLV